MPETFIKKTYALFWAFFLCVKTSIITHSRLCG